MPKPFTVTELSTRIRNSLEETFGVVDIVGEVTDYRGPNGAGHHYFSLKDDASRISMVLFAGRASLLRVKVENGKKLHVTGKVTAFAGTSRYQIIVSSMTDAGVGDLAVKFEEMKNRLAAEGLFDESRKKKLPMLPRHIGVVTSTTGAVIRDFVNVLTRRYPNIDVLIAQARVQGDGAAKEIAQGVTDLNKVGVPGSGFLEDRPRREVSVVMRGGGSMEELWCFNEEIVARAIAASGIPVISGVGHQTDFTICDFVSDLRAPTPSAAAELLVLPKADFEAMTERYKERIDNLLESLITSLKSRLLQAANHRVFSEPAHALEAYIQRVDVNAMAMDNLLTHTLHARREQLSRLASAIAVMRAKRIPEIENRIASLQTRMEHSLELSVKNKKAALSSSLKQLNALSPLSVLNRGYSITMLPDGRALRSADDALPGTELTTLLADNQKVISTVDGNTATETNKTPIHKKKKIVKDDAPTLF